jgi:alkanesulfonate monooxygenase SsuD/methylene tetrahydromethanopterin reductase-like flavin-dependent oxidoreductase (luciferase family)
VEEAAIILRNMLDGTGGTFEGPHYRLEMMLNNPPPLHRVPLMIGGSGERKTLGLVARLADACNILVPEPGESRRKLELLRRHCEDVGRDYEEIETTSLVEIDMRRGAPAVLESLRQQHQEGIEHVIVNLPDAHEPATLERLAKEVLAPLRD